MRATSSATAWLRPQVPGWPGRGRKYRDCRALASAFMEATFALSSFNFLVMNQLHYFVLKLNFS
jgi:hypothetical protein